MPWAAWKRGALGRGGLRCLGGDQTPLRAQDEPKVSAGHSCPPTHSWQLNLECAGQGWGLDGFRELAGISLGGGKVPRFIQV